jgi:transposase
MAEICDEEGVKYSTADNWVRKRKRDMSIDMKKQKSSAKYSAEQKFKILMATGSMSEHELGVYLRKEGLFSAQLDEWKKEFLLSVTSFKKPKKSKDERDKKIKSLEREILRKDKALAEASALLILQKKVSLIWGNSDEGEA